MNKQLVTPPQNQPIFQDNNNNHNRSARLLQLSLQQQQPISDIILPRKLNINSTSLMSMSLFGERDMLTSSHPFVSTKSPILSNMNRKIPPAMPSPSSRISPSNMYKSAVTIQKLDLEKDSNSEKPTFELLPHTPSRSRVARQRRSLYLRESSAPQEIVSKSMDNQPLLVEQLINKRQTNPLKQFLLGTKSNAENNYEVS